MSRKKEIFDLNNSLFWIILGLIIFLSSPLFRNYFYNDDKLMVWLNQFDTTRIVQIDTSGLQKNDKNIISVNWNWKDFENKNQLIKFSFLKRDLEKAFYYRVKYDRIFFMPSKLYSDFVNISMPVLDSMTNAFKKGIKTNKYTEDIQVLNYVVSAIQYPEYTKISDKDECPCNDMGRDWVNDCNPRKDGKGCCNNVVPFAVYTPTEFIYYKTGDCDTKSLIAYAILKKLGYDAAIIEGYANHGPHAMLAIANVRPVIFSRYVKKNSKIYFPWEVTSRINEFVLGNVGMWHTWDNWSVVLN
jgi:hypothetical protein